MLKISRNDAEELVELASEIIDDLRAGELDLDAASRLWTEAVNRRLIRARLARHGMYEALLARLDSRIC